jgi:hypothetical protein
MPAQRQIADDSPSSISQAAQIWGEGPEITPYATDFVPPAWFTDVSGVSGGIGGGGSSGSVSGTDWVAVTTSQVPDTHDLEWTAGDTAKFEFYFDGVCWVEEEPTDSLGLTWAMTKWHSQVRGASWVYWGYWWPPLWPGYRYITSFVVTAEFMDDFNSLGPGTMGPSTVPPSGLVSSSGISRLTPTPTPSTWRTTRCGPGCRARPRSGRR